MKNIITIIFLCTLISCKEKVRKLPYYDTADFTPKWEMENKETFHAIRKFNLTDQEGKAFTEKNLDGKICVADFFFTSCPGICLKMAVSMTDLQKEFLADGDVLLVSHSVTPAKDSVPILKKYAADKGVQYNKWKLLTGTVSEIYDLGRKFYYVEEDLGEKSDTSVFLHTENFVLIDKNRHIRGIYNGLDNNSMTALKNDIKDLKKED
jgi:protein SCO1